MFSLLTQFSVLYILSWLLWRFVKQVFFKTDLDRLPGPAPQSFFKGNLSQLFDPDGWEFHKNIAKQFGGVIKIRGLFGSRDLYVFDPKALHHIIVKDQYIYEETESFTVGNAISFGEGIFSTLGERHRKQRKMLNPVFSIAHMRHMMPMFSDVANKLEKTIRRKITQGNSEIDVLHWMNRAALEMIGQSGLGYSFDSLEDEGQPHPFSKAVQSFVPLMSTMSFERQYFLPILAKFGTPQLRRFAVDCVPWKNLHSLRDVIDTMDRASTAIFEAKKKAFKEGDEALLMQVGQAKDLLSILMKANMEASDEDRLPDKEVLGQMSSFIFAATDTTSNALSRTLHLLSMHPEAQDRLREELEEARTAYGDIPYDILVDRLHFLDAVCRETLRLYPPVSTLLRETRQDIVLPFSSPIKGVDGREIDSILVPNGTKVFMSILNANRDPALWGDDSYEWKPERWLSPLPQAVHDAHMPGVYSHLMTFLGGGRACLGFKFSQLEMSRLVYSSFAISLFPAEKGYYLENDWDRMPDNRRPPARTTAAFEGGASRNIMNWVSLVPILIVKDVAELPLKVEVLKA